MEGSVGKVFSFFGGGFKTLWGWLTFLVKGVYSGIDYALVNWHGVVSGILEALLLGGIAFLIWSRVWVKRVITKPGQPPQVTHNPQPYRLLALCGILVLVLLIACVVGS